MTSSGLYGFVSATVRRIQRLLEGIGSFNPPHLLPDPQPGLTALAPGYAKETPYSMKSGALGALDLGLILASGR
jgi:hypothetical protein